MLGKDVNPEVLGEEPPVVRSSDAALEHPGAPSLEISNALARLHKQYVGRGPTGTRTTIDGDLVVCLLEGGFTRAEQTLEANDQADLVAAGRVGLQDAMRDGMIDAVRSIVGRNVRSFMSANDLRRNLQVEVFVLEDNDFGADENPDH